MIEGHAGGGDQHEVQSRRQSQVEMNAPDNAQDSAALQFNLEVAARQGTEFTVSYHIRNVPVLSTIEMSPGCVVVFSLECALKRSPVVRAKRKCVFQRAALRSLGWKTMASSSANPGATDGLS